LWGVERTKDCAKAEGCETVHESKRAQYEHREEVEGCKYAEGCERMQGSERRVVEGCERAEDAYEGQ
jgi:hypothetical protein